MNSLRMTALSRTNALFAFIAAGLCSLPLPLHAQAAKNANGTIAFVRNGSVLTISSTSKRQIPATQTIAKIDESYTIDSASWAPNGRYLLLGGSAIWVVDRQNRSTRPLIGPGKSLFLSLPAQLNAPAWLPDSRRFVFSAENVQDLKDGQYLLSVDKNEPPQQLGSSTAKHQSISPNGKTIVYSNTCAPTVASIANLGTTTALPPSTKRPDCAADFGWSPNGRTLATLCTNQNGILKRLVIETVNAKKPLATCSLKEGKTLIDFRKLPPAFATGLSWSPDGSSIAFGTDGRVKLGASRGTGKNIWVVPVTDGQRVRKLVANASLPAWRPRQG